MNSIVYASTENEQLVFLTGASPIMWHCGILCKPYIMPDIQYNTDRLRCDSQISHSLSSRLRRWSCRSKPAHLGWGLCWCRWCIFRSASLRSGGVVHSSVAWETIGFLRRKNVEKHPRQQSKRKRGATGRLMSGDLHHCHGNGVWICWCYETLSLEVGSLKSHRNTR